MRSIFLNGIVMLNKTSTTFEMILSQFNRKERHWGLHALLASVEIDDQFRSLIKEKIDVDVPPTAWWAIDYHFDWLHAALTCFEQQLEPLELRPQSNARQVIKGNQEDIDFIIAFDETVLLV
ncbi:hypothetical protein T281_02390 [Rhodomicrobium udaipurense JA643]|nr:hypothetical protein T281_02390 [Rhodomicrobium udaipurense JA643]